MAKKRKIIEQEYLLESSPFYRDNIILRAALNQLNLEDKDNVVLARKRYFKQDDYVKVITTKEYNLSNYYRLSNLAKTVMFYIIYNCLEFNSPTFRLVVKDLAQMIGLKDDSAIHKAIKELIANEDIARTKTREVYWINFNRYYKGVYVVDKFIKKKS